jgi:hypothetical protein
MIAISILGGSRKKELRERIVRPGQPVEIDLRGRHPTVHRGYRFRGRA